MLYLVTNSKGKDLGRAINWGYEILKYQLEATSVMIADLPPLSHGFLADKNQGGFSFIHA